MTILSTHKYKQHNIFKNVSGFCSYFFIWIMSSVLLLTFSVNVYAQKEGLDEIDSLQHALAKMPKENNVKASLYEQIGMEYYFLKDFDKASLFFSKAGEIYDNAGNKYGVGRVTQMNDQIAQNKEEAGRKKMEQMAIIAVIIVLALAFGIMVWRHKKERRANMMLIEEQRKSEELLLNILPEHVAHQLRTKGMTFSEQFDSVTVIFSDFVGFTKIAEQFSPNQLVGELHTCFKAFDEGLAAFNIEKIKTVGDAYLAVAGLNSKSKDHAANAIAFATFMQDTMRNRRKLMGDATFDMRVGLHSGSVIAGIVGVKKYAYDIWGDTVNIAARMEQNCEAGEINISQSTYELAKDKFDFLYRGEIEAKNKGKLKMYYVMSKNVSRVTRKPGMA